MVDVALVNPPILGKKPSILIPPLGIEYLASTLKQGGIEPKIIDASVLGLGIEETVKAVMQYSPQIVGITGTTPVIDSAYTLAKKLRDKVKWLILGGAHCSAVRGKVFEECPELDFGFIGEGEKEFPKLVKKLLKGEEIKEIKGVIYPGGSSEPVRVSDLDSIPFPAWHLMRIDRFRHPLFAGLRVATMITTRGCPYQCIFCDKSVCGSRYRARSPESVLKEIEELRNNYQAQALIFYDDLFTFEPERAMEICKEMVKQGIKIRWKCEGRVNLVSEELLEWMKRAGCEVIAYGIETAHQKGLDWLGKGVKVEEVISAVKLTSQAGIKVLGYFIFGIPVESYEEELASIEFAKELGLDYVQFGSLSPFPGSRLYELAMKNGWYKEARAPAPEEYGEKRPLLITDYWTEERLKKILKEAYKRFYFRPGYILRTGFRRSGIIDLARSGFRLGRWLRR